MFDFLKKKLKLFEKNIETEIESELKKEEKHEKSFHEDSQKPLPPEPNTVNKQMSSFTPPAGLHKLLHNHQEGRATNSSTPPCFPLDKTTECLSSQPTKKLANKDAKSQ